MKLLHAESEEQIAIARELFLEYAESLNFSLCFQNFNQELSQLPGNYARPNGRLFLAYDGEQLAGCVALRKISESDCEMKRLYLRPYHRGKGLGRLLAEAIILEAKEIGYKRMLLDTISSMQEAISLYKSIGFATTQPYTYNPIQGVVYMELYLDKY